MTLEKPEGIRYELRSFTADEAERLVEASPNWRTLDLVRRDQYANAMAQKRWSWENGEALAFDENQLLVNGQHRLSAAAKFMREQGVDKVWFWCAAGVERKVEPSLDQGKPRRFYHYLRKEQVKNASWVTTILTGDAMCRHYGLDGSEKHSFLPMFNGGYKAGQGRSYAPTTATLIDLWLRQAKVVSSWAAIGRKIANSKLSRGSTLVALGFQLAKRRPLEALLFFARLETGKDLKSNDPIWLLRERLRKEHLSPQQSSRETIAALLVKAWSAWMNGDTIESLRYNGTGPKAEAFPAVRAVNG
jgi:hypothetical protein